MRACHVAHPARNRGVGRFCKGSPGIWNDAATSHASYASHLAIPSRHIFVFLCSAGSLCCVQTRIFFSSTDWVRISGCRRHSLASRATVRKPFRRLWSTSAAPTETRQTRGFSHKSQSRNPSSKFFAARRTPRGETWTELRELRELRARGDLSRKTKYEKGRTHQSDHLKGDHGTPSEGLISKL